MSVDEYLGKGVGAYGTERSKNTPDDIAKLHEQSDVDVRSEAQHHTLGAGQDQAAPGNHTHDGGTSSPLWAGNTITGSRGGNMALSSVISILVQKGVVDSTTN